MCLVAHSCLTLCNPMDSSPPGSSVHGDSPGKNTRVGCHALLQGDLPNPGIEPRSPALQADSLPSEPPGKPILACSQLKCAWFFKPQNKMLFRDIIPPPKINNIPCYIINTSCGTFFSDFWGQRDLQLSLTTSTLVAVKILSFLQLVWNLSKYFFHENPQDGATLS